MAEAEQVQCPNCGGYRTSATDITEKLDIKQYEKVSIEGMIFYWFCFVITAFGFYGLALLSENVRTVLFTGKYTITTKTIGYKYLCGLCNYKWDWMIGTPKPIVNSKPDLIVLAAKKLEEEEEARRRRRLNED
jgi:hypothetical protein